MMEFVDIIVNTGAESDDFHGNYIFESEAQEQLYEYFKGLPCEEILKGIMALGYQIERMETLGVEIDVSTGYKASDYQSQMEMAVLALRDKEQAGLC